MAAAITRPSEARPSGCPVAHHPAGAIDHRDESHDVVELEVLFQHEIDGAAGEQAVAVAIAAEAAQPRRRTEPLEGGEPVCRKTILRYRAEARLRQRRAAADPRGGANAMRLSGAPTQRTLRAGTSMTPTTGQSRSPPGCPFIAQTAFRVSTQRGSRMTERARICFHAPYL